MFEKIARNCGRFWFAAAALLSACRGDSTGLNTLAPNYDLVSYNDASLPLEIRRIVDISPTTGQQVYCSDQLVAGQLETQPQKRFRETESTVIKCDDGRPDVSSSTIVEGSYAVNGADVTLTSDSFDYGGLPATMTMSASVSGEDLTISQRVVRRSDGQLFSDQTRLGFRVHH